MLVKYDLFFWIEGKPTNAKDQNFHVPDNFNAQTNCNLSIQQAENTNPNQTSKEHKKNDIIQAATLRCTYTIYKIRAICEAIENSSKEESNATPNLTNLIYTPRTNQKHQ